MTTTDLGEEAWAAQFRAAADQATSTVTFDAVRTLDGVHRRLDRGGRAAPPRRPPGLRMALAGLATAGLAGALVIGLPGSDPSSTTPFSVNAAAADVTIADSGEAFTITFGDLSADPRNVAAALAQQGVDADVTFVPASPSLVGDLVATGESPEAAGRVTYEYRDAGEASGDVVSMTIPKDVADDVEIGVGRRAEDGETYVTAAQSAALPGEVLHCVPVQGKVRDLLPGLRATGVELLWRDPDNRDAAAEDVLDHYVNAATPWAPDTVLITTTLTPPEESALSAGYRAALAEGC